MKWAFYNEIDRYCCDWISNLMDAGHIRPGVICDKPIQELTVDDVRGYERCHFFAGIGVWDYALNLAGWNGPVWTGSCPCQPFSAAGRGAGFGDERHLWPHWARLIGECRPDTVFGEQVSSKDGRAWFDFVSADLEALGYAVGALATTAAGVGAPHIRQRLYFVGDSEREGLQEQRRDGGIPRSQVESLARQGAERAGASTGEKPGYSLGLRSKNQGTAWGAPERGAVNGFWRDAIWLPCIDGKARATQPGLFPLASGITNRVGRLRAYGNAIVAPQASEFIKAYMECRP